MSKIDEYKEKQAELEAIKAIAKLTITQVVYTEGGAVNQFIVEDASPLAVSAMLRFIYKNGVEFIGRMIQEAEAEVKEWEGYAIDEANQFIDGLK